MPSTPSKPLPAQWNVIQSASARRLLNLIVLFGCFTLIASLLRIPITGFLPVYALNILMAAGLLVAYFSRKQFNEQGLARLNIAAPVAIGVVGLASFGLLGGALPWFLVALIVIVIHLGQREALVAAAVFGLYIVLVMILFGVGVFRLSYDANQYAVSLEGWFANLLGMVAAGTTLGVVFSNQQRELLAGLAAAETQKQQFDTLFSMLPDAMVVVNPGGLVLDVNPAAQAILPKSMDQVVGKHLREIGVSAIAALDLKPGSSETHFVNADGKMEYFEAEVAPLNKGNARAGGYLIHLVNVTKRKEDEVSLSQLTQTLEQSQVSAIITDPMGRIEYVNPFFSALTGYGFAESVGKNLKSLRAAEEFDEIWKTMQAGKTWKGESQNRKKNGELYWEQAIFAPLLLPDGELVNVIATSVDITQPKKLEKDLQASREQFAQWMMSAPEAMFSVNAEGRIVFANQAASHLLGHSLEKLVGGSIEMLVPVGLREKHIQHRAGYLKDPQMRRMGDGLAVTARRLDGSEVPVEITLSQMTTEQGSLVLAFVQDVSERQQNAEQLRNALAQLEEQATEIAGLQFTLRERPNRDPLTNVYNRRFLEDILEREFHLTRRRYQCVSIMMLEIDRLANIQQHHGQSAADHALMALARILQEYFRKSDIVCRYEDDVFLALLPDLTLDLATQRAEELKTLVSAATVETNLQNLKITISMGLASSPNHGEKPDEIIQKASRALQISKKAGRNRYTIWSEDMEE